MNTQRCPAIPHSRKLEYGGVTPFDTEKKMVGFGYSNVEGTPLQYMNLRNVTCASSDKFSRPDGPSSVIFNWSSWWRAKWFSGVNVKFRWILSTINMRVEIGSFILCLSLLFFIHKSDLPASVICDFSIIFLRRILGQSGGERRYNYDI